MKSNAIRGTTPYDINSLNKMALRNNVKPLTPRQLAKMSKTDVNKWIKQVGRVNKTNVRNMSAASKQFRKNAGAIASENLQQAKLTHATIRQGLAEIGALGAQALSQTGAAAISKNVASRDAIDQNTAGGVVPSGSAGTNTEVGPVVNYSYQGRDED